MPRTKTNLVSILAKLPQFLEKTSALEKRLSNLEKILLGTISEKPIKRVRRKRRRRKKAQEKICTVSGCKRKVYAKGLCVNHYQKAWREKKLSQKPAQ